MSKDNQHYEKVPHSISPKAEVAQFLNESVLCYKKKDPDDLIESYQLSAELHAKTFQKIYKDLANKEEQINRLTHSFSWRITKPLRLLRYLSRGRLPTGHSFKEAQNRILEIYQDEGYRGVYQRIKSRLPVFSRRSTSVPVFDLRKEQVFFSDSSKDPLYIYKQPLPKGDLKKLSPFILIIGEVTLPQCAKYRIWQKQEHFQRLGWYCCVVDWRDTQSAMSALQVCTEVIFYRVPGFPSVIELIKESKRLGLSPWWEVDDLIFDRELYLQCGYMDMLPSKEKELLLSGAKLFRKAMLACDRGIASTRALAGFMQEVGLKEVIVIENALDEETLRLSKALYHPSNSNNESPKNQKEVIILYGSGTKTHNADFMIAAEGLLAAMKKEACLSLHIVGELQLPPEFDTVSKQVKYIPSQIYQVYLGLLSKADIAIAPLEAIHFNDAKSNIKYLEASVLGLPSICSPRQAFSDVIDHGANGLLASDPKEWEQAFLLLAHDAELRKRIGEAAYEAVHKRYEPQIITDTQVKPIFGEAVSSVKEKTKILVVNIYYDPYSFGGATLVTEEMVRHLEEDTCVEVSVFTSRPFIQGITTGLLRYHAKGSSVYSTTISAIDEQTQSIDNIEVSTSFEQVLEAVKPDIVHFHSIQGFGLPLLRSCQWRNIPYIITLHDAWWLCERQFMVRADGKYCFQDKIDLHVCQLCVPHVSHLDQRAFMMQQGLKRAALLLSPSESHKQLYVANGIPAELIQVNHNGVPRPKTVRPSRPKNTPIRFGFAAGNETVKGYPLIRKVFSQLSRGDWELKIIDSKVNLGYPPMNPRHWGTKGKITILPPYNKETMDDFFYGIDVLLFPSQWKESYGLTVREALLRDVWVICSAPGGQSEAVRDGINGTYISLNGNVDELKEAVENILDHPNQFETYTNPFKEEIASHEGQAQELLRIFQQIKIDSDNVIRA